VLNWAQEKNFAFSINLTEFARRTVPRS